MEKVQGILSKGIPLRALFEKNMEEFFEMKLGSMTIESYDKRFLELKKFENFVKY